MNFISDYAQLLRQRLNTAGYQAVMGETDEDSILRYLNVLHRSVEPRRRETKKAAGFFARLSFKRGWIYSSGKVKWETICVHIKAKTL